MQVEVEQLAGRRLAIRTRGNEVIVDDTLEAGGPGDGFRPSELLLGALGTCMMGTLITFARNQDIEVSSLSISLEDETAEHPERIGTIRATMRFDTNADDRQMATLRRIAAACKIHHTLDRSTDVEIEFASAGSA